MSANTSGPEGRRLQVLGSNPSSRQSLSVNGRAHPARVANPNRSLSYSYGGVELQESPIIELPGISG